MKRLHWLLFLLLLLGVVGCDVTTKQLAVTGLGAGPLELLPGVLELRLAANTDTAFSLLGGLLGPQTRFFLIVSLQLAVLVAMLTWTIRRWRMARRIEQLASLLILAGALGNLGDRLVRGHVIDFIHVTWWPIFNVADIAITGGIGLLMIVLYREQRGEPTAPRTTPAEDADRRSGG